MRLSNQIALVVALALVIGCAPVPPFEFKPEAPNLNIAMSNKRPLKVGIVVQDPMPYSLVYNGEKGYHRDSTADVRAQGFPLERELSKVAYETLSQVFTQAVVLRELPLPGQYDAVINLNIGQILLQERVIVTGETCDLTIEWSMSVLDSRNKEIYIKKGISPAHNFKFSILSPSRDITIGMNENMPLILNELAREWGVALYSLEITPATGDKP